MLHLYHIAFIKVCRSKFVFSNIAITTCHKINFVITQIDMRKQIFRY